METPDPKDEVKILIVGAYSDPILSRFREAIKSMKQFGRIVNLVHVDVMHPELNDIVAVRDGSNKFKTMERMLTEHMLNVSYTAFGGNPRHIPRGERIPHRQRSDKRKYPH